MKRVFLMFVLFCFFVPTFLWAAPSPTGEVKEIVNSVLKVLNRPDDDYATKRQNVSGLVQCHLDVDSISRRTLGKNWKKASPEQQERFADLFVQVLEQTYLNRIEDYSGGKVDYLKERIKGDKAIVDTRFVSAKVEIPVQYKMILHNDLWQIYDVVIENVSLVRNYRSSYGDIISSEGFDGLFTRMESKLAEPVGAGSKQ